MKKFHIEKIEKPFMIPDSVICNKCGREFKYEHYNNNFNTFHDYTENAQMEFHHYEETGGYYSKIGDMTKFKFDICDNCLIEFMTNMIIPPEFEDMDATGEDWDAQKHYEEWLDKKRQELSAHKPNCATKEK